MMSEGPGMFAFSISWTYLQRNSVLELEIVVVDDPEEKTIRSRQSCPVCSEEEWQLGRAKNNNQISKINEKIDIITSPKICVLNYLGRPLLYWPWM